MILIMNGLNLCMNELVIPGFNTEPESGVRMNRYGACHCYSCKSNNVVLLDIEGKMYSCLYSVVDGCDFPCLIEANVLFQEN